MGLGARSGRVDSRTLLEQDDAGELVLVVFWRPEVDARYAALKVPAETAIYQHMRDGRRTRQTTHISRYVSKASFIATSSSRRRYSGTWPSSIDGEY